eukprot:2953425-Pleurochrysis_carterae.AAC.1
MQDQGNRRQGGETRHVQARAPETHSRTRRQTEWNKTSSWERHKSTSVLQFTSAPIRAEPQAGEWAAPHKQVKTDPRNRAPHEDTTECVQRTRGRVGAPAGPKPASVFGENWREAGKSCHKHQAMGSVTWLLTTLMSGGQGVETCLVSGKEQAKQSETRRQLAIMMERGWIPAVRSQKTTITHNMLAHPSLNTVLHATRPSRRLELTTYNRNRRDKKIAPKRGTMNQQERQEYEAHIPRSMPGQDHQAKQCKTKGIEDRVGRQGM